MEKGVEMGPIVSATLFVGACVVDYVFNHSRLSRLIRGRNRKIKEEDLYT